MRPRPLGRAAAGAGLPQEPKPGTWQHSERQAGPEEHDQFFLRSADRISHLRLSSDHLLLQLPPPVGTHPGRPHQLRQHPKLCGQHLAQVCFPPLTAEDGGWWLSRRRSRSSPAGCGRDAAPAATAGGISRTRTAEGCPAAVGTGLGETLTRARGRRAGRQATPPPTPTSHTVWVSVAAPV